MKTLDEVISRLEPVAEHNTMWFDEHHCIVGETTVKDALHYLKEYRDRKEMLRNWTEKAISEQQNLSDAITFLQAYRKERGCG